MRGPKGRLLVLAIPVSVWGGGRLPAQGAPAPPLAHTIEAVRAYNRVGQGDSALMVAAGGLGRARSGSDRVAEAALLVEVGIAYGWLGRTDSALAAIVAGLALAERLGPAALADGNGRVGRAARSWRERIKLGLQRFPADPLDPLLPMARTAFMVAEWRQRPLTAARSGWQLAHLFRRVGELDSAEAWGQRAAEGFRRAGADDRLIVTLGFLADLEVARGQTEAAAGTGGHRARLVAGIAEVDSLWRRGLLTLDLQERIRLDQEALRLAEARGLTGFRLTLLQALGSAYSELGRPDSALPWYRAAVAFATSVGDQDRLAEALAASARVEETLLRWDVAREHFTRAIALLRGGDAPIVLARALDDLGQLLGRMGEPDSALALTREAHDLLLAEASGFMEAVKRDELPRDDGSEDAGSGVLREDMLWLRYPLKMLVGATRQLGTLYGEQGAGDSSVAVFQFGLEIAQLARLPEDEAQIRVELGFEWLHLGQPDSALPLADSALAWARRSADPLTEGVALGLQSLVYARLPGGTPRSRAYSDTVAALLGTSAMRLSNDADRIAHGETYRFFQDSRLQTQFYTYLETGSQDDALRALAVSEQGRAQAMLALMGRSPSLGPDADLLADGRRLAAAGTRGGTTVLSYHLLDDEVLGLAIRPDGQVIPFSVPVSATRVRMLIARWRQDLRVGGGGSTRGDPGRPDLRLERRRVISSARGAPQTDSARMELNRILLPGYIQGVLQDSGEVLIVPQGPLALIPFAALSLPGDSVPLGARHSLRFAPSLAVLEATQVGEEPVSRGAARSFPGALVVGNPTMPRADDAGGTPTELPALPGAEREGRWVAGRLGVPLLTGGRASEAAVRAALRKAPLVHLATHGFAYSNEARARESFVALAPGAGADGRLTVGELLDDESLVMRAELVALSACQSGLGDLKSAEGTVGLQRAFLARGARSLLVSLWSVSDEATDLLMRSFYSHWLDDADLPGKAEALRRAQGDLRRREGYSRPQAWAAFQLVGAD